MDPTNPKRAYEFFVELNKHHYYMSVIRDYETFKDRDNSNEDSDWHVRMTDQYEYALDHLKQD